MDATPSCAIPGRTLIYGLASMPWNDNDNGWALPGGDVASGKNAARAIAIAKRMDAMIDAGLKTPEARASWLHFRPQALAA